MPDFKKDYYEKTFGRPWVIIEGVATGKPSKTFFGLFFKRLFRLMLRTESVIIRERYQIWSMKKNWRAVLFVYIAQNIGKLKFALPFFRWLDYHLTPHYFFNEVFNKYQPALIFATDVQNENDICFVREAKKRKIPVVGMVRSWDNLTIHSILQVIPDQLLVWNDILKNEAIRYSGIPENQIPVVGIPHYDRYLKSQKMPRDEFFKKIGANPDKKLIFYAPIGDMYQYENDTDQLVIEMLAKRDENIFVRFPPNDRVSYLDNFSPPPLMFLNRPGMAYDKKITGNRDVTREDDDMLINGLYWSNLIITGPSTIAIEAALFDKPIIMVNLHRKPKSGLLGIYSYGYDHLGYILRSGGVRKVDEVDDFTNWINRYLTDPSLDKEGRTRIVKEQCGGKSDAKASERVAKEFLEKLK